MPSPSAVSIPRRAIAVAVVANAASFVAGTIAGNLWPEVFG